MKMNVMNFINGGFVKHWTEGVPIESDVWEQTKKITKLPFVEMVCLMPDAHYGIGCSIGTVVVTKGAVVPSLVGVDQSCGMNCFNTGMKYDDIKDNLQEIKDNIEKSIPHGANLNRNEIDYGSWQDIPNKVQSHWDLSLKEGFQYLSNKYPGIKNHHNNVNQLGTLGGGNHFIEISKDDNDYIWVVVHSGSRGIGNKISRVFIDLAKSECKKWFIELPDPDLSYFPQNTEYFKDYMLSVEWCKNFACINRSIMVNMVADIFLSIYGSSKLNFSDFIDCNHNFVAWENHFGKNVLVTRKGAINASLGKNGIIPGSMGDYTYLVKGLGNKESYNSSSHGAGRIMSRNKARKSITLEEHKKNTDGILCRKDESILDESPSAYKNIEDVMAAQIELTEVKNRLKQVICIKG